jgi:hypothetical protein
MKKTATHLSDAIALPPDRLQIAITGHRESNPSFAANHRKIASAVSAIFDVADKVVARQPDTLATTRLICLLAHGADLLAVDNAVERGWPVVAPLPFGLALNIAINSDPADAEQAKAVLNGRSSGDPELERRAAHIRKIAEQAMLFELADEDAKVTGLFLQTLTDRKNDTAAQAYHNLTSERAATAGRIMIEQADMLLAIWDGVSPGSIGGTRHTIAAAINSGTPVLWIDAKQPDRIKLLRMPEDLYVLGTDMPVSKAEEIETAFESILNPESSDHIESAVRFHTEQWHPRSSRRFHGYRRIEALFGGFRAVERFGTIRQIYEEPDMIASGSGATLLNNARKLSVSNDKFVDTIACEILRRFAWADGLSTYLSDAYRGGMIANFLLSAMAIICGIAYLPLASVETKWPFALAEFLLLATILAITFIGRRNRWHSRWFETRRVAEYLRHAPIMLLLGVARATRRWPSCANTEWPEYYAREVLRETGLPQVVIDQHYLHGVLNGLLLPHVAQQKAYHEDKALRLTRVHFKLDQFSEILFGLAVLSVATFLLLTLLGGFFVPLSDFVHKGSKLFTFLAVSLPALGGAFAGIRYFGDFERFAAISEGTAEKLGQIQQRIEILKRIPVDELRYSQLAEIAHGVDDIVIAEIENWQSVFDSKQITVPV